MEKKDKKPIRILVWGDSPQAATGFATVVKGVFTPLALSGKYDIDIIGINDRGGWKDPSKFPYRIYPARFATEAGGGDFHGRPRLVAALLGQDPDVVPPWDIVFTINDPFILEQPIPVFGQGTLEILRKTQQTYVDKNIPPSWYFKLVSYWPVDSSLKGNWVQKSIALTDYSVAYSNYGLKEIEKADRYLTPPTRVAERTRVIYHGVDTQIFKPMETEEVEKFRSKFFEGRVHKDTFVIGVIARNQYRKDLPRTLAIFKEFHKRRPDSFLYVHAQENDAGGSLMESARSIGLELGKDWGFPSGFNANKGVSATAVNMIYNASNCILSTSLGEGWGLYNSEAMATKTLLVVPNNTTHPEILGYDPKEDISDMEILYQKVRGVPYKCGSTSSEWTAAGGANDFERMRPIGNVEDAVKKLLWVYDNPDKVKQIEDRAYEWIQQYTWDKIVPEWDKLFQEVYKNLEEERSKVKWEPNKPSTQ